MLTTERFTPATPALVAKTDDRHVEHYLRLTSAGRAEWIDDPKAATAFASMREAMRMAMRLPGGLRAFGLPRSAELAAWTAH